MSRAAAHGILKRCARAGIREYCLCAGARNIELVVPLAESAAVKTWHFFEERSAAFFAVGRMMRTGRPVAVVTTSGTAAAELLPAIIEAHYQGLPFVALTADRPEVYRGTGAPQAIEQEGIYGVYAETSLDGWSGRGPLHLNVCQDEPEAGERKVELDVGKWRVEELERESFGEFLKDSEGLVAMLGALREEEREETLDFLSRLEAPVYAEAVSGLRESVALSDFRVTERDLRRMKIRKVLRIGGVPACRFWRDLEGMEEVEVLSLTHTGFAGLARASRVIRRGDFQCSGVGQSRSFAIEGRRYETLFEQFPRSECALVRALSGTIPRGSNVFLGNSLPIREWNLAATDEDRGFQCFAARGANGIDGQVSAFLGVSEGAEESWLVCGDLTAMYDLGAPSIASQLSPGRRRIVVLNNGGGRIFDRLPPLKDLSDASSRVIANAHSRSFEAWAAMWGWDYRLVHDGAALSAPVHAENAVLEVVPDARQSEAFWKALP